MSDDNNRKVAGSVLHTALLAVTKERGPQHGSAEKQFAMTAEFWQTYLENRNGMIPGTINITAGDVGLMMDLLKTTRVVHGDKTYDDHYADKAGYVGLSAGLNGVKTPEARVEEASTAAMAKALAPRPTQPIPPQSYTKDPATGASI